ncbi:helix-turn-helix transcriptional regulator [Aquitalea denitrificans]|uniref:helix-turn-helix transcriptional regulator n=1 Tax=Aquitalea denitrificans TaxID=519081 RepID=UPI001358C538|nr:hypothetical protein [Aquitalea denitrificans]
MAVEQYTASNRYSDLVSVATAAVEWQGLTREQQDLVVVEDGLPYLGGAPELRERAEALLDAAQRRKIQGRTHTEDGDDLPARQVMMYRTSVAAYIESVAPITALAALAAEPAAGPADTLLRINAVLAALGVGRSTLYRRIADGLIEKPAVDNPPRWHKSYIDGLVKGDEQ